MMELLIMHIADGMLAVTEYNMRVFHGTIRKYYRWQDWSQPVLTHNGSSTIMWLEDPKLTGAKNNSAQTQIETWGTSPMSYFNDAYRSMDADKGNSFYLSASSKSTVQEYTQQTYDVLDICFPQYMKITHIKVVCNFQNGYHCALHRIIGYTVNDDGTLGTKLFNTTGSNTKTTLETDVTVNHRTRKLRLCLRPDWNNGGYRCRVQEITVTAQKAVDGNSSNYAFYEDTQSYLPLYLNGEYRAFQEN